MSSTALATVGFLPSVRRASGASTRCRPHLSPGARDLIRRMLLVDPMKRVTIPEIRQHPWFTAKLARYLRGAAAKRRGASETGERLASK